MDSYPTKLVENFAAKTLRIFYQKSVAMEITNQDYEGQIEDQSSIVNILTFAAIEARTYTGSNMSSADDLSESNAQLVTDQAKAFYFKVKSYDKFRSYIKNPEGTILEQVANEIKKVIDVYVLGFHTEVAAGQRVGTSYTTGTVAIDTAGAVTGSSTTFTAAMVGKGFKALGHDVWYRIRSRSGATAIVIEKDLDDSDNDYDGGVISAGATYEIQANTAVQATSSTVYDQFRAAAAYLDDAEVPEDDRWTVVPPSISNLMLKSGQLDNNTETARREVGQKGYVGEFAGFKVFKASAQRLTGDATNGWHIMAGHKSAITFAMGMTENGIEDLTGNFGKAYKSLYVYGAKVPDERRKALTELFLKL